MLQSQLDIYWAWTADPSSTAYNLPAVLPFPKAIDMQRLQAALQLVVSRRKVLHTRFTTDAHGQPRQYADMQHEVPVVLRQMSEADARHYIDHGFVRPFKSDGSEPLCRFELIDTPLHNYLLLDIHHTIADGLTITHNLIENDLVNAYKGLALEAEPAGVPVLYQAAAAETEVFASPAYENDRQYFRKLFNGVDFVRFGRSVAKPWGEAAVAVAAPLPVDDVRNWCRAHGVPVAHLMMAAFSIVLAKLKGLSRVAFFVLHDGRIARPGLDINRRQLSRVYGMFVRSIPFVAEVCADMPLSQFVHALQSQLMSSLRHSIYPSSHFCRDMQVTPTITFGYQSDNILEELTIDNQHVVGRQLPHGRVSNDLGCLIYMKNGHFEIRVDSSTTLNSLATLQLVADSVRQCVLNMMRGERREERRESLQLGNISIINEAQQQALIALGKGIGKSQSSKLKVQSSKLKVQSSEFTICDLILQQARRSPDALAVADAEGALTYAQLDNLSADLSRELCAQGLGNGEFVNLLSTARKEFLVWVLAVWRAGGAYVPLDPNQPATRLSRQMEQTDARLLLSDQPWTADQRLQLIKTLSLGSQKLYIYSRTNTGVRRYEGTEVRDMPIQPQISNLKSQTSIADTAYMMFTSGSTGEPKGVVVPHRAVVNLVRFVAHEWRLNANSRICCHSSFAFDASVEDLFPALTVGGSVHIVPESARRDVARLHAFLCDQHITGGCFTTRLGLLLADYAPLPLQYICLGGERLTRCPQTSARVLNTYGPTECCVDATWCELTPSAHYDDIPIGRPLPNVQAYIADPHGQLLPHGAEGELLLGGAQIADGYWQKPMLTAERFVESKFGAGRVYRTGDIVRWGDDGFLYFVGRSDQQLKIDGHRIETAEVEHALQQVEGVEQAAVAAQQLNGRRLLCAYYTARQPIEATQMRAALAQLLPSYMIPRRFVFMSQLPTDLNGKTDYSQLPPITEERSEKTAVKTGTAMEQTLCEAFEKALQVESVTPDDNFFDLGGTSIMVMQLVVEAERRGLPLAFGDVYRWPTPALLAEGMISRGYEGTRVRGYENTLGNGEMHGEESGEGYASGKAILAPSYPRTLVPPRDTVSPKNNVLLTGATGLLGSHVLYELLLSAEERGERREERGENTQHPTPPLPFGEVERGLAKRGLDIVCLVRSLDGFSGRERLWRAMDYYFGLQTRVGGVALNDLLARRVEVHEGDLTHDDVFIGLEGRFTGRVIHCAADVRHYAADNSIKAVNVDGTRRVVDFCIANRCELEHVSTVSVLLGSTNEYVRTKTEAEQIVNLATGKHGLRACIMRMGNLMPRLSDGRYQPHAESNALLASLRLLAEMGAYPNELKQLQIDFSPVDCMARALVTLTDGCFVHKLCTKPADEDFSVHNMFTICQSPLLSVGKVLSKYGGARPVTAEQFATLFAALPDTHRKAALFGFHTLMGAERPADYDYRQMTQLANKNIAQTNQTLNDLGFVWPHLGDAFFDAIFATS